tara:strand:+ start:1297 stop:1668 length:372 start_codon:yes stop_codon:yes gene_type:complete
MQIATITFWARRTLDWEVEPDYELKETREVEVDELEDIPEGENAAKWNTFLKRGYSRSASRDIRFYGDVGATVTVPCRAADEQLQKARQVTEDLAREAMLELFENEKRDIDELVDTAREDMYR